MGTGLSEDSDLQNATSVLKERDDARKKPTRPGLLL